MIERILNRLFTRINITGGEDDSIYLVRWIILRTKKWKLMVHKMVRPDHDRCLHDHPWRFISLVLYGGYYEEIDGLKQPRWNYPGKFIFNKPQHMHRISKLPRGVCWTLVLAGNKVREWGFKTREGWKHWTEFLDPENLKRFTLWCKDNDG